MEGKRRDRIKKVYFNSGDVVKLKGIDSPIMKVYDKDMGDRAGGDKIFIGIKCMWFNSSLKVERGTFSSKDLVHIENMETKHLSPDFDFLQEVLGRISELEKKVNVETVAKKNPAK